MNSHDSNERNHFQSRIRSVADRISNALGIQPENNQSGDSDLSREEINRQVVQPFRAWWDFNKPWRNKK